MTFILSVLLAVVVVVAAVGAGVGASVAVNNARNAAAVSTTTVTQTVTQTAAGPTATESGSATTTAPITVATNAIIDFDCASESAQQTVTLGDDGPVSTFQVHCNGDYQGDRIDIVSPIVYSFQDCLLACASYNHYSGNATGCVGVEFNANLSAIVPLVYGNCFLKAYTADLVPGIGGLAAAAELISTPTQ